MNKFTVRSLPLKDVIRDLSREMNTSFSEKCSEYILEVPPTIGAGEIRGINFENGLGIIVYRCSFTKYTEISFTVDEVHPLKYLYTANGAIKHQFSNEKTVHDLVPKMSALVASKEHKGHILKFEANRKVDVISLEVDRARFVENIKCQLTDLSLELSEILRDTKASKTYYHEGFYSLEFQEILSSVDLYKRNSLVRKLHLESKALDIFVEQIRLFEDDINGHLKERLLRYSELERVEGLSKYIDNNLSQDLSIDSLSLYSGLNPSKLQKGFKYLFDSTVRKFIEHRKVERAKVLLLSTQQPIASISISCGFESPSYFSKVFKEYTEHTPSMFRKLYDRPS